MRTRIRKIEDLVESSTNAAITILKSRGVVIRDSERKELSEAVAEILREYLEDTMK